MLFSSKSPKVIIQGITSTTGTAHTEVMLHYGTNIVAGVRPGAAGQTVAGVPVFNTVKDAVTDTGADTSVLFVPAPFLKETALEALDAGIKLLVMIPEYVPQQDAMIIVSKAKEVGAHLIGPNTPGLITKNFKLGFLPEDFYTPGDVAIISRSGTNLYQCMQSLTKAGIGQSICIGVGGDNIIGTTPAELGPMLESDPDTKSILLVGEIGGTAEEDFAELVTNHKITKPVYSFIAGHSVPPGKRMGHAGAIISGNKGTVESKTAALTAAGIPVAKYITDVVPLLKQSL